MPLTIDPYTYASAPVIVALHSSGASGRQWDGWRKRLPARAICHTPDLIGYDAAGRPAGGVHLIGHSYGASVALQIALRWPGHVRSLTLYEPVRFALLRDADAALWRGIVALGRDIDALTLQGRLDEAAERFVDYWSRSGAWQALTLQQRQAVAARMPKVCAEFEALFEDELPPAAYRQLRMPLRLLCGTRSPRPALRVTERLAQHCPGATLVRLDGLGHLGPIEDAGRVLAQFVPQFAQRLPLAA